jgi:hypothetical protein
MKKKKSFAEFQHPIPLYDMRIIANHRLCVLQSIGVAPLSDTGIKVEPFRCYTRGYVLQDGIVLMFDPDLFDVRNSVLTVRNCEPPFEVWILSDDKVVDYFELGGENKL